MKATLLYIAIFALVLLLVPMIALNYEIPLPSDVQTQIHIPSMPQSSPGSDKSGSAAENTSPEAEPVDEADGESPDAQPNSVQPDNLSTIAGVETFRILDETTGEIHELTVQEYVRGAVAAEMPASFHPEALKAQAVAAHTYALHNHMAQQKNPDPALKGADFSADPGNLRGYMTEESAREFYGDLADTAWTKICEAADSVLDCVLEYEEEPIVAAYHAISAGQTEDAANVWTGSAPYLQPVDSPGDLLAPDYETAATFSPTELRAALAAAYPGIVLAEDPAEWFGEPVRSESGYVTEIPVGDQVLHGKEIRQMLELRSHNFDVQYTDAGFTFHVYGYGHGVGLSQYGADYYARQGEDFREILAHYYDGAELRVVETAS